MTPAERDAVRAYRDALAAYHGPHDPGADYGARRVACEAALRRVFALAGLDYAGPISDRNSTTNTKAGTATGGSG